MILEWMAAGEGELTPENYKERMEKESEILTSYDYSSLVGQTDYEDDYEAARLLGFEYP